MTLLEEQWLGDKKILMLEPRRLAASSIAQRMADLLDEPLGKKVGYQIRFDRKISSQTKLEVITEGILTRMMQKDNALEEVGLLIFDEFHERSLHADLGLALAKEIQQVLRPDLKILVMSATMDLKTLADKLSAPVIYCEGKQYPVEIEYLGQADLSHLPQMVNSAIGRALSQSQGDILVFLPGQGEIKKTAKMVQNNYRELSVHTLFGQLPHKKQQEAILPHPSGQRKVVLSTSIAETSLTIEGVHVVIDSGFTRTSQYDPKTGLSSLVTLPITIDAADQRAGRAGRLGPGKCYRLWSKATHQYLSPYRQPEILEADLCGLLLEVSKWGVDALQTLGWVTPPPTLSVVAARETLEAIGALEDGKLTSLGDKLQYMPCHPRIANMLIKSQELGLQSLATDLAAVLEEKDPMPSGSGIDINLRIEALRRYRSDKFKHKAYANVEKVAEIYRKMLKSKEDNSLVAPTDTGMLLAYVFPERIAARRLGKLPQFQLSNGKLAKMDRMDLMADDAWISIAHLDAREGMGKIFLASPLDPKDLKPFVKVRSRITWNSKQGGLLARQEWKIGQLLLQSRPLKDPDTEQMKEAIFQGLKQEGERLLNFTEKVKQWQNRVLSVKHWHPDQGWPDVSTSKLMETSRDWLFPFLPAVEKTEDLEQVDLMQLLPGLLSYDQQKELERLAPESVEVPSGSKIDIQYFPDGDTPVLAARIQEMFGWEQTPTVNEGKQILLIHLLSPGYKPVQVTSDLKSFWDNTYHEVKKELKRRYPKHYWPDDPWNAPPVKGVKRK